MKTNWKNYLTVLFISLSVIACTDDDDDTPSQSGNNNITPVDTELITTVQVIITDSATSTVEDTVEFRDTDGQGGNAPSIEAINLMNGNTYTVELKFLDESDPADIEDKTAEILAEDDEHLVCFASSNTTAISIERTDSDGTYEIGLSSKWKTLTTVSNASLNITLKHQPGVKDGSCAPGDTDIDVSFPLSIQ